MFSLEHGCNLACYCQGLTVPDMKDQIYQASLFTVLKFLQFLQKRNRINVEFINKRNHRNSLLYVLFLLAHIKSAQNKRIQMTIKFYFLYSTTLYSTILDKQIYQKIVLSVTSYFDKHFIMKYLSVLSGPMIINFERSQSKSFSRPHDFTKKQN